ncbi:hypothetical protein ACEF11_10965, partial [[Pasteurella] aerogenes]
FATAEDVSFNSTTIGGKAASAPDATDGKAPITIGTVGDKNVIGGLDTTIEAPTTVATTTKPTGDVLNHAATIGDVLNAGWNLQENGQARDVVTPYDTVNFTNGTGTVVNISTTDNVSTVKVDVNTSELVGNITNNDNGTVSVGDNDGDKLANITTVTNAINNASFNVTIGSDNTAITDQEGKAPAKVKPGSELVLQSGKNLVAKQNGTTITFATAEDVSFNSTTIGGKAASAPDATDDKAPITIGTVGDKNVIGGLDTTIEAP